MIWDKKMSNSRKTQVISLALFLLSVLSTSCGESRSRRKDTAHLNESNNENMIILQIQESYFFNSDLKKYISLVTGEDSKALSDVSQSRLFDSFVEEKLLSRSAREKDLALTQEEQKQYLAKLAKVSRSGERTVPVDEKESGALLEGLLVDKYIYELVKDIKVQDDEASEYYDLYKREFLRPERVKVSQILLDTEERAIEIKDKLEKGNEEAFRKMAIEYSLGMEASRGGLMGVFEMNQLPFEMEKVVFSLKEKETSQVVESSYGFHIFRVDEKYEPELIPLEEALPEIKVKILDQKMKQSIRQHIMELREEMEWSVFLQNLTFPYQKDPYE
jgi:parvulin-like peptidyl-prolyl isomerase